MVAFSSRCATYLTVQRSTSRWVGRVEKCGSPPWKIGRVVPQVPAHLRFPQNKNSPGPGSALVMSLIHMQSSFRLPFSTVRTLDTGTNYIMDVLPWMRFLSVRVYVSHVRSFSAEHWVLSYQVVAEVSDSWSYSCIRSSGHRLLWVS